MKRVKMNFRLPVKLMEWVKEYAEENNKTTTQVIVDLLTKLKKRVERGEED